MTSGNTEILDIIKGEHDQVKGLFQQFEQTITSDQERAMSISQQIMKDLKMHTELEDKLVYPRLREQDASLFHEAEAEHHVVELLMNELQGMQVSDPSYQAKMKVMRENVESHVQEEETVMFDKLRMLPADTLSQMAESWRTEESRMMA